MKTYKEWAIENDFIRVFSDDEAMYAKLAYEDGIKEALSMIKKRIEFLESKPGNLVNCSRILDEEYWIGIQSWKFS